MWKKLFHKYIIYTNSGKKKLMFNLINGYKNKWDWSWEVIITNIDKEGTWSGFDFNLVRYVSEMMTMPVIANGGCGSKEHLKNF